jgi:hypothetical protein
MRDFFKGWRRKAGCVTLVMALAMVALWSRSYLTNDIGMLAVGDWQHEFSSIDGEILWRCWRPVGIRPADGYERIPVNALQRVASVKGVHWLSRFDNSDTRRIAYWSLILPPTILAAVLLLWPRRKRLAPPRPDQH